MMYTVGIEQATQRTLTNTIHREIGCFTDEVNKAKQCYFLSDVETKRIDDFFDSLSARKLGEKQTSPSNDDLLIVFDSEKNNQSIFYKQVQEFKEAGGHVAAVLVNREIDYFPLVNEVLGVNINQADIDKFGTKEIFAKTVDYLFDKIDEKILHFEEK